MTKHHYFTPYRLYLSIMILRKNVCYLLTTYFILFQSNISLGQNDSICYFTKTNYVIPAVGITYGILAISIPSIGDIDKDVKMHIAGDRKIRIDDVFPAIPMGGIYGLSLIGIKGKSNLKDYSYKLLLANALNLSIVNAVKYTTKIQRPDMTTFNSFPSGHTSSAFVGAELFHQEYGNKSGWYSLAGYGLATATGYLRMYNNRHWLSDVVAGAGVGILSTKFAYWLYPKLKKSLMKNNKNANTYIIVPSYNGFALTYNF